MLLGMRRAAIVRVNAAELRQRTFSFAVAVNRLARRWLRDLETRHVATQLIRAGSSVASNYRAACLARSPAEFAAKIGVVREESDESLFWLEFSEAAFDEPVSEERKALREEASELTRIFGASFITAQRRAKSQ
jgi:four helix bundle protein